MNCGPRAQGSQLAGEGKAEERARQQLGADPSAETGEVHREVDPGGKGGEEA